jgi:hypothetical protein
VYHVEIVFKNQERIIFYAQEFNIELDRPPAGDWRVPNPFTYKAHNGEELTIYLIPVEVAGIVVTPN